MAQKVVNAGLQLLLDRLAGVDVAAIGYQALGTGTGAWAATDTALGTEVKRNAIGTKTVSGASLVCSTFFGTSEAVGTLTEAGILNAAAAGTLLDRSILSPSEVKTATQQMIVDVTLTLSAI